jgi:hypothetical protein
MPQQLENDVRLARPFLTNSCLTESIGSRKVVDDSDEDEAFEAKKSPVKTKATKKEYAKRNTSATSR